jgi:hypothetical protein
VEIVQDEGQAALRLVGGMHTRLYWPERKLRDFSVELRMKKTTGNYAGVEVRDHWRVYLQMRGFLSLNSDLSGMLGELFKSAEQFTGYQTLKVVCAGPLLHAYVDGRHIFTHRIPPGEGRVALYSHGKGEAFYQHVRIASGAAPEHIEEVKEAYANLGTRPVCRTCTPVGSCRRSRPTKRVASASR